MDSSKRQENRERIALLCSAEFANQFREHNRNLHYQQTAACRDTVYNAADKDFLESRKRELGVTNSDILMIFNNLVGRVITDATLRRKLAGRSDFTATEILVLAIILVMTPNEIIGCFHLLPEF